jgi:hypothetical protein
MKCLKKALAWRAVPHMSREIWAPIGKRPIALGHHRFDWLHVTAFVSPATGETFWRDLLVCA